MRSPAMSEGANTRIKYFADNEDGETTMFLVDGFVIPGLLNVDAEILTIFERTENDYVELDEDAIGVLDTETIALRLTDQRMNDEEFLVEKQEQAELEF